MSRSVLPLRSACRPSLARSGGSERRWIGDPRSAYSGHHPPPTASRLSLGRGRLDGIGLGELVEHDARVVDAVAAQCCDEVLGGDLGAVGVVHDQRPSCCSMTAGPIVLPGSLATMTVMTIAKVVDDRPGWGRPSLATAGGLVAFGSVLAAFRLPINDSTVWLEAMAVAGSAVVLVAVAWRLLSRTGVADRRLVLTWGLGSGWVLGGLWIAEIAFNNLTPHSLSTATARGVLDNVTWAIVGVVTAAAAVRVTARTRRWRSGLRTGAWSGVASGLGASTGGALLLGFLRPSVERDPLMLTEWQHRAPGVDLSTYVTQETMAGVFGHLWVLGLAQGALLGLIAALLTAVAGRLWTNRLLRPHRPPRQPRTLTRPGG